ncbi:mRNP complex [Schizosaccharomyces cryophilus OY26]|uniref:MRNP complex n=1 Tax=Schizosaccharomyces cryophilus (strain OY26 / ATCC MYA-4695 / CBS 11777 / NBRC 106824 / NRRL Y48691) TaxID=653667 RepID=S9X9E5_SCHCR|nr:mRNP complex [Schizosaccharomyces cryophilus OY26]EPY50321.1 mRNP complex [Schizosaccharomyces cryophilus OY26]
MSSNKPVRPDETAHKNALNELDAKINEVKKQFSEHKEKLGTIRGGGSLQEKNAELRTELDKIRNAQSSIRTSKQALINKVKAQDEALKKKINDLNALRKTVPYKSEADLDRHVRQLQAAVDSGTLKIVDEKKYLREITQCNRTRRSFTELNTLQSAVDTMKSELNELRNQLNDPESKKLSENFVQIRSQLDEVRQKQDSYYKDQRKIFSERDAQKAVLDELYNQRRGLQREYDTQLRAFRTYEREQRAKRQEQIRLEREARDKEKKQAVAQRKLEEASIPAFTEEILACENLLKMFHVSIGSSQASEIDSVKQSPANNMRPRSLAPRHVDPIPEGTVLKKDNSDDDAIFSGLKKSKPKKSNKNNHNNQADSDRLNLSLGTIKEFDFVGVEAPLTKTQVEPAIEQLKERIGELKGKQDSATKERIEKAKKELEKIEISFTRKAETEATPVIEQEAA